MNQKDDTVHSSPR